MTINPNITPAANEIDAERLAMMAIEEPGQLVEMICGDCGKPFKTTRMGRIAVTAKGAHPRCPDCKNAWNQHRTLLRQQRLRAERTEVQYDS